MTIIDFIENTEHDEEFYFRLYHMMENYFQAKVPSPLAVRT